MSAAHTPGPWIADENGLTVDAKSILTIARSSNGLEPLAFISGYFGQEAQLANARLIAEAGTVAHETGLTPRQLADALEHEQNVSFRTSATLLQEKVTALASQRNELLEALKLAEKRAEWLYKKVKNADENNMAYGLFTDIKTALSKAQQEG